MAKATNAERYRFVAAMLELKKLDPRAYEQLKAEAWEAIAKAHPEKTPAEMAEWMRGAS
jgi:hypothetical protein